MDDFLIIFAGILMIAGLLGSITPYLPGIVLSYLGIIVIHFSSIAEYSSHFFVRWGLIIIAVQGLSYVVPEWGKKKFGRNRSIGLLSLLGMLAGLYFGKWGVISGAIIGATIGELFLGKAGFDLVKKTPVKFAFIVTGTIIQIIVAGALFLHYTNALSYII